MARGTWRVGLAGAAVGLLLLAVVVLRSGASSTRLTFLAVGQGDCAVFQHAGATVLIDAGPLTDTFDAGERIVAPELGRLGVETIDLVLLSHPDSDHVGGLPALARRFPIGRVVIPAVFREHAEMGRVLKEAGIAMDRVSWLRWTASRGSTAALFSEWGVSRFDWTGRLGVRRWRTTTTVRCSCI